MPYDKSNPPDRIKGLPVHAQDVWMSAFNSAWDQYGGDEEKCNAVAWSAVEKAGYKKDKDGNWIKEEDKEEKEIIDRGDKPLERIKLKETNCFENAEKIRPHVYKVELMNLEEPSVPVRGWSLNDRYYSDRALESLAKLLNHKRAMGTGHHDEGKLRDEVGLYRNVQKVPGVKIINGELKIIGEAQTWLEPLIDEQISEPKANLCTLSINAPRAIGFKGERNGKRGEIIENVIRAYGCDIVFDAAAGGKFKSLLESNMRKKKMTEILEEMTLEELKEERPDLVEKILREDKKKISDLEIEVNKLKAQEAIGISKVLAERLIGGSKLTKGQAIGLLESMVGKTEAEMKEEIENRKEFLKAIAPEIKVTNLSEKDDSSTEIKPLTETEKMVIKQLNITEESFRKSRGEKITEKK